MFRQAARSVRRAVVRTAVVTVTSVGVLEVTTHLPSQGRSSEFYHMIANEWVTPLMRRFLDPEGEPLHRVRVSFDQYYLQKPLTITLHIFRNFKSRSPSRHLLGKTRTGSTAPPLRRGTAHHRRIHRLWQNLYEFDRSRSGL